MGNDKKEWMDKLECTKKVDKNMPVWRIVDMALDVDSVEHMDVDECGVDQSTHVEDKEIDSYMEVVLCVDNSALYVDVDKWKVDLQ